MNKSNKCIIICSVLFIILLIASTVSCGLTDSASSSGSKPNSTTSSLLPDSSQSSPAISSPSNNSDEQTPSPTANNSQDPSSPDASDPEKSDFPFVIVFLDVGEGDAAVIICDGHAALIDGGPSSKSSLVYSYLQARSLDHLDFVFATHADEDHIGGLAGALNYATADKVYCSVDNDDTKAFASFKKYVEKQGNTITIPSAGEALQLGSASIYILGPINHVSEDNNNSLVIRIVYKETSFLFTGDMQREEEQDLLESGCVLRSTVLKVGHHGSKNATTYPFLREVLPEYAVISVGDNPYGHPTDDVLSKLRDSDTKVFRTDLQGDIICFSDGVSVSFSVEKNADADTLTPGAAAVPTSVPKTNPTSEPESNTQKYILNTNTKVFHYPRCSSVQQMNEANKKEFEGTRDEVIAMGYRPCGRCNP